MSKLSKLETMRSASYLLTDPGGEVVRELIDQIDSLTKENKRLEGEVVNWKAVVTDQCELEDEAKNIAGKLLTVLEVNGDSHGVPTIACVVELLVERAEKAEQQRDALRNGLKWIAASGIDGGHYQSHSSLVKLAQKALRQAEKLNPGESDGRD